MSTSRILFLLAFVLTAGCDSAVDINQDAYVEQLYVDCGIVLEDSTIMTYAFVTRTIPFGSTRLEQPNDRDAIVEIRIGDEPYTLSLDSTGAYFARTGIGIKGATEAFLTVHSNGLSVQSALENIFYHPTISDAKIDSTDPHADALSLVLQPGIPTNGCILYLQTQFESGYRSVYFSTNPHASFGMHELHDTFSVVKTILPKGRYTKGDTLVLITDVYSRSYNDMGLDPMPNQFHVPRFLDGIEPYNLERHYNVHGDGFGYFHSRSRFPIQRVVIE